MHENLRVLELRVESHGKACQGGECGPGEITWGLNRPVSSPWLYSLIRGKGVLPSSVGS